MMTLINCLVWLTCGFLAVTSAKIRIPRLNGARSVNKFGNVLYSELARTNDSKNIFFSPFSIHVALSLAFVGARGNTAREMSAAMKLPNKLRKVPTSFRRHLGGARVQNTNHSATLQVANKIYVAQSFDIKKEYEDSAKELFVSEVERVNFDSPETVKAINGWVEKKTHEKIKDIVSKGNVNGNTKLVLVSAVYFKDLWNQAFDKSKTITTPFRTTKKTVEMMHTSGEFGLTKNQDLGADILDMDYKGGYYSLVVILPFDEDGLSEVEQKLRGIDFKKLWKSLKSKQRVEVKIPKMKLEQSIDLGEPLKALGMKDMWGSGADFSGISQGIYVSAVVHKAFIEVDESGTEAAAATGVLPVKISMIIDNYPKFIADHPFLFILRNKRSGTILFMGRFTDPQ